MYRNNSDLSLKCAGTLKEIQNKSGKKYFARFTALFDNNLFLTLAKVINKTKNKKLPHI